MKVPARIYADEDLLAKMRTDRTIQQCVNVTHLNGIYKYAITMPDGHEGYGFPIGGVAATDYDEGLISPGGVGYDINCICGSSLVLSDYGYRQPISSLFLTWKSQRIRCIEKQSSAGGTDIVHFIVQKPSRSVYRVRTLTGHEIFATEDHPFLTPTGMVELGKLGKSRVAVFPFEGVDYDEPSEFMIVDRNNIRSLPIPGNHQKLCDELEKRELLPLTSTNEKLPLLLKLIGFIMGDGSLTFTPKTHIAWFFGKREDLGEIRKDVEKLGFNPSRIYYRNRAHKIETTYGSTSSNSMNTPLV
jgi:tRNA-splicing ligase RtcB